MLSDSLAAVRDIGRLYDIAGVLIRHGLGDSVRRLGLAGRLEQAGHMLHWEHAADLAQLPPAVQVRMAMEELGPAFVKLGQLLAGRSDLLGPEWITEFGKLQNQVPAVPMEQLRPQLREDLGGEPEDVFAHFDPVPLAAASIAQVHRARLKDGSEVIVKIRRPGIAETIEADLALLAHLAALAEANLAWLKPYHAPLLVREFAKSLRRELDLAVECRNAERIAQNLRSLPCIMVPRVHWQHTGVRLNVQDFVQGVPGDQLQRLLLEDGFDRALLARRGAQAVLKMTVQDGFFHADPHPGNVFYLQGNRIAFIDFGMVGRLSERRRSDVLQLLSGLVQRDAQKVCDVLLDWAGDDHGVSLSQLEAEIDTFVDQYHGSRLADLNLGQMLGDIAAILRDNQLSLPSDLALLVKAFISLESMGRGLDPDFHVVTLATPLLRQVVRAGYRPQALARRGWKGLLRLLSVAEQLPEDLSRLLRNARRGRVQVGIELAHLKRVGDQVDRAASRLAMALVIAALIVGSSIVMNVQGGPTVLGLPLFGFMGFVAAVLGGLWLLRSIARSGRSADDDSAG